LDASKSVVVVGSLLDKDEQNRSDFVEDIKEQYREERSAYLATQKEKQFVTLAKAREKKFVIDFKAHPTPKPASALNQPIVFKDFPLQKLVGAIDWNPFFQVWRLRGKYPNRNYPKLFNDPTVGVEAKKLFGEAQALLTDMISNKKVHARGVISFFAANSSDEDITLFSDDQHTKTLGKLFGIRQQEVKTESLEMEHVALGDFVAPSGHDYVGMFAVGIFGADELADEYSKKKNDDYNAIMVKALADRLAEAFAEVLHAEVRRNYWGYSPDESFSAAELHKIKYQGIRPAPGYPSQPDHDEKRTIWKLMNVHENTGLSLTESLAMMPASSVSGLYFGNPMSKYFSTGKITKEQVESYAKRKGMSVEELERLMPNVLSYDK